MKNTAEFINWKKEKQGVVDLPEFFLSEELKPALIKEVIRWQRACARQGTHKAKTRGDVSGGGKKPFRQKGTGNARQGSIRSPLNRTGGVTFGPKPRSYKYSLPSKVRKQALKQVLAYLWREDKVLFLQDMKSSQGKTKELSQNLKDLGLKRALLVDQGVNPLLKRACSNLESFQLLSAEGLNVYDLLKYDRLVMSKKGLSFLASRYEEEKKL